MNAMISDDDLTRLLEQAGSSFDVPVEGPSWVLEERGEASVRPWVRRRALPLGAAAAAVVALVLVLQSLGGAGTSLEKQQVFGASAGVGAPGGVGGGFAGTAGGTSSGAAPAPEQQAFRGAAGDLSALTPASVPAAAAPGVPSAPRTASGVVASGPAGGKQPATSTGFADGARIVQTGSIGLVVEKGKVGPVALKVRALAATVTGYVADEKSTEIGSDPTSSLTLRVPVAAFQKTVDAVRNTVGEGIGKVESSTASAADITAQYADLQAQLQSLRAARERFLAILSRANTIGETLSVQQRVDAVQGQIDQIEGRRRVLEKQSELATLTVSVSEKPKEIKDLRVRSGLSQAFHDAWRGFTTGVESLIAHSGRGLLVLIVGIVALLVGRLGWRLARRRLV